MSLLLRRRMLIAQQRKSKNLCDVDYFLNNYVDTYSYDYVKIYVGKGNPVTVSIDQKFPLGLNFYFNVTYRVYTGQGGAEELWIYHSSVGDYCKKSVTFTSKQDYIYVNVFEVANFKKYVKHLQVEISNHATEYEPM